MQILKIVSGTDGGGVLACETQFITYWSRQNIDVDLIIVGDGPALSTYGALGRHRWQIPALNYQFVGSPTQLMKSIFQIQLHARSQSARLREQLPTEYRAIIYSRPNLLHFAAALKRINSTPIFWHMPASVNRKTGYIYYNLYISRHGITPIANSHYTKRSIGPQCSHVVYPGYNENRTASYGTSMRAKLGIPSNATVFGTAARLHPDKAQDLLILGLEHADLLKTKDVHCVIAGGPLDTPFACKLKLLAQKYPRQIHLLGPVTEIADFYSTIDIYVNTRRNEEPFGISIAEAMGSALPVIAYKKGGPSETVIDGKTGWLIDEPTIHSYSKTFATAYSYRDQWRAIGAEAQASSSPLSVSYNAKKFLDIIACNSPSS